MMNNDATLRQRLEEHLHTKVSDEFLMEATGMLLRVLFCMDNATILPRFFVGRGYFELARDTRELKIALLHNGYTLRNCKFFVNAVALRKARLEDFHKFEVRKEDALLLLDAAHKYKVSSYCRLLAKDFKYVSMEKFSQALAEELSASKMITFMDKFLHKKLKWVMNTQGLRPYDIKTEFISHTIVRVYRTFPRIENRIHLRNLMRQVIHARGQSMIVETKKSKRNNLLKNPDGSFIGRLAPFHLIPQDMLDSNAENLSCSITGGDRTAEQEWVFKQDLAAIIRAHSTTVKRHRFLTAVFDAQKNPSFIAYLRCSVAGLEEKSSADQIPEFMMETLPKDFVTHAIEFSSIEADEAIQLLRTIKDECM